MHLALVRRGSTRSRRLAVLAAFALAVTTLAGANGATAAPTPASTPVDSGMVLFQVRPVGDPTALADALTAAGYDVDGGGAGLLFVHAPAAAAAALAARTDLTIVSAEPIVFLDEPTPASQDALLPARLKGGEYETFYGGYRTVDAYEEFTDDLATTYPELVQVMTYGESYTGDNDLRVVCVTANADDGCELQPDVDKARFLFVAQIHARELTTSEMTWRLMTYLVDGYGDDADVTALLDETELWIVPQINPDGVEEVQRGFLGQGGDTFQRKNMHEEQDCGGGQIGTDLNRNYDTDWDGGGSSDFPCSETYHGASPASEPETFHLQDLMHDIFEDQRGSGASDPAPADTRGIMITLHTYGNLVLFPYGDERHTPNDAGLRSIGFRYSHYNGYETGEPDEILYVVSGSTDDYAYDKLGIPGSTFEIGTSGFHPPFSQQDGFWSLNREAFLYAARVAQQPYTMGLGPTLLDAKSKNKSAKRAVVKATADDDAYGTSGVGRPASQNVTDGRVFVGTAPWDGGTAKAMKVKGSGKEVGLTITLKRKAVDKLVWVQAKDSAGNWGPTRAVWLRAG